jgi:dephospho-CoA kinase
MMCCELDRRWFWPYICVEMSGRKKIIGIIGGICSGKSSVAAEFARLGCAVVHADEIVDELLETKSVRDKIAAVFGPDIFADDGRIDRALLAGRVFSDQLSVDRINGILHPPVLERCGQLMGQYSCRDDVKIIVLDMPLLVEVGWQNRCDIVVFVDCDDALRAQRAVEKGLSPENSIKKREKFQISLDKKRQIADYSVDNNSGWQAMAGQVVRIISII